MRSKGGIWHKVPYHFITMKKMLITGGSGFVGRNVYEYFKMNRKYDVYAPTSSELNCIDEEAVKEYLLKNKFDIILHFAVYGDGIDKAKDGTKILEYNLRIFYNFAKYSNLYEKMIYAGSGAEYDKRYPICSVKEEDIGRTVPTDQYGLMKYTAGLLIDKSRNIYNLRLFGIFGKYEYWPIKFISNVCCKALYELPLTIRQNVYFDYLWIEDFCEILDKFLKIDKPIYHSYNIVSGERVDLVSICNYVMEAAQKDMRIVVCKEGFANEYTANNDRIRKEIADISFTPINQSIKALLAWYQLKKEEIDIYKLLY